MAAKGLARLLKENEDFLSFGDTPRERQYYKSGIVGLNFIVSDSGGKGIPGGSLVEVIGESTHGKSTLMLDFIATAQQSGNLQEIEIPEGKKSRMINAVYVDIERSFDAKYAASLGVDISKLLVVKTLYVEQAFQLAEELLLAGIQFMVVDSAGMIVSQSEEGKGYEDNEKIGSEAKALGRFLKRTNALLDHNDGILFVINHYRANLSPMARSDKKPYGAHIFKYATKVKLKIVRISMKKGRAETQVIVEKTKLGETGLTVHFDIISGKGIDLAGHILTLATEYGIVRRDGAWYKYGENDEYRAQGLPKAVETLPIEAIKEQVIKFMETNTFDIEEEGGE